LDVLRPALARRSNGGRHDAARRFAYAERCNPTQRRNTIMEPKQFNTLIAAILASGEPGALSKITEADALHELLEKWEDFAVEAGWLNRLPPDED